MKTKKQADREYYLKNRTRLIKKASIYNSKHKRKRKEQYYSFKSNSPASRRKRYLLRVYKLSPDIYEAMRLSQQGKCAICKLEKKRLVVDHCHNTGRVRSLLCTTCNAGLGQFKDSTSLLEASIKYLNQFK